MIKMWNLLLKEAGKELVWFQDQLAIYMGNSNIVFSVSKNVKRKFNFVLPSFSSLTLRAVLKADDFKNPYWIILCYFWSIEFGLWNWMLESLLAYSRLAFPVFLCLSWHVCLSKICKPRISRNWIVDTNTKMWNFLNRLGSDNWELFSKAAILL